MNATYKNAIFGTMMVLMLGISSSQVMAIEVENVVFQKEVRVGDQSLELKGAGVLYYLRFIKAYVGALYVPPGTAPDGVLADTPKRLEVEYFHALNGEDFGPATYKGLSKNLGQEAIDRMRDRIEYHNSLYVDVKPGDRYSLTYLPGIGTELALNGEPKGIIEGADFAAAIFSLWLGEYPFDARFKKSLLGLDG
ncbi:MAG: chalcone isomerase family protein [Desulfosarcina sp.]